MTDQIRKAQQDLRQAMAERQQLQHQLQTLSRAKPSPPSGSSTNRTATAEYQKALSDWQNQVGAVMAQIKAKDIRAKDAQIKSLETQRGQLQARLRALQGGPTPRHQQPSK
jgi:chromosome segregation ATPase